MTKELIAKLEALEGPNADIFQEVFKIAYPEPDGLFATDKKLLDRQNWLLAKILFSKRLACHAWESAAIMLVPDGWHYEIKNDGLTSRKPFLVMPWAYIAHGREYYSSFAAHPAIALLICILKAKEPVE